MKYKHTAQQAYCCVPACMQMVLRRRGLRVPSQADIAYDLGFVHGYGTRIDLERYSLDSFFKKHGYPLKEQYFPAASFKLEEFGGFLRFNIEQGNDILICFNQAILCRKGSARGHACLVEKIQTEVVALRDPNPKMRSTRKVLLHSLLRAMKQHRGGGIWVIS